MGSGGSTLRFRQIKFFTCCLIASFLRKYTTGFKAEFKGTASHSPKLKIAGGDSTQAGMRFIILKKRNRVETMMIVIVASLFVLTGPLLFLGATFRLINVQIHNTLDIATTDSIVDIITKTK